MMSVNVVRRNGGMTPRRWLLWIVLLIGGLITVFPLYWMLATAVSAGGQIQSGGLRLWPSHAYWSNFSEAWNSLPVETWFRNSLTITVLSVTLRVVTSLMAGFAFAKFRFRGRTTLFFAYLITVMVPIQVIMVPEFVIVSQLGMADTIWGVILPGIASGVSAFIARQFMLEIPDELLEAAKVDGANIASTFVRIVLPLCWPLIAVLIILGFVGEWNEFLWPLIVLQSPDHYTLSIGLNTLNGAFYAPWDIIMAVTLMSVLPVVIVFVLFQRRFIQGIATTGIK